MKKFLAMFLALLMVFSLVACGGEAEKTNPPSTQQPSNTDAPQNTEPAGPAQGEEIPYTPLLHLDFETAAGLTAVRQVAATEDPVLTGATYALAESKHEIIIAKDYGPVGSSLMLDGKYGVMVNDMPKTSDDTYTIAFWYAADRYSNFGPILQIGHNVGMNDVENEVCWINFTKQEWAYGGGENAPFAWNRNSKTGTFPWIGNNIDLQGKREWLHVALVVDGTTYDDDASVATDGIARPHVGAQFYINGVLVMEASAADIGLKDDAGLTIDNNWKGVAPGILNTEGVKGIECLLGVNYWDQYSKEYIDEFYLYDEALTAGQVATLYSMGTAPAYQTMPTYEGPTDDDSGAPAGPEPIDPSTLGAAPVDSGAIDTLGNPDRTLPWWTDNTGSYAVVEGKTTTLNINNYSCAANNWSNFCLVLCANEFDTNAFASGDPAVCTVPDYVEYAVQRSDAFGWGPEGYSATYETSWGADWVSWLNMMTNVKASVAITRAGNVVTIDYTFTGGDGTVMTEKAVVTTTAPADGPIYVFVEGEGAYIELLSVE